MVAGGIGAAYINFFGGGATAVILPGLLALPTYIADSYIHIIIGISISIALAFGATLVLGIGSKKDKEGNPSEEISATKLDVIPFAPGKIVELNQVDDPVFSTGVMGNGFAIIPTEGKVVAPFTGKVSMVFETKHAIGLRSNNGVEVLIHIGLDTVNLKGQYFKVHVKEGDTVSKGQLLVEFDLDKIKELGYDTVIPFIVTNGAEFTNVTPKILPDSVEISLV